MGQNETEARTTPDPQERPVLCRPARLALTGLGVLCVGLGILGLIVPGMPGTVFLLIALWAFSRSSERLHTWLYTHPRLGAPLRDWHRERAISTRAKVLAVGLLGISILTAFTVLEDWRVSTAVVVILIPIATWIATRPRPVSETI